MAENFQLSDIDWSASDAVWDSVPGAERLWLLYGYFPRFTSARLVSLTPAPGEFDTVIYIAEEVLDGYDAHAPSGEAD